MNPYHELIARVFQTRAGGWMFVNVLHHIDRRLMRWSSGRLNAGLGTDFRKNGVLLRCTGARSGQRHDIPLLATPLGERFVLIASAGGRPRNPAWYYNLKANPECSLIVSGRGEIACVAHEAQGDERQQAWAAANAQYSGYTSYQNRVERQIPVMILTPVSP
jgi:deazaflavin-dependent oxidoreductase (nitroreductase family)